MTGKLSLLPDLLGNWRGCQLPLLWKLPGGGSLVQQEKVTERATCTAASCELIMSKSVMAFRPPNLEFTSTHTSFCTWPHFLSPRRSRNSAKRPTFAPSAQNSSCPFRIPSCSTVQHQSRVFGITGIELICMASYSPFVVTDPPTPQGRMIWGSTGPTT